MYGGSPGSSAGERAVGGRDIVPDLPTEPGAGSRPFSDAAGVRSAARPVARMLGAVNRTPSGRRLRNADAAALLETLFVTAVVSFLGIRAFLALTGYPRIGGGGLHIAHMLWGGLLMLLALGLLLLFLDRSLQWLAAAVAGLGFGTFIDEIGKFLTADNNYFFRPAVALIYVIFVTLFLVGHAAVGRRSLSPREALANALDLLQAHLDRPIAPDDRARIRALLRHAPPDNALVPELRRYLDGLPQAVVRDRWLKALPSRLARRYERLAANAWFDAALVAAVVAYTGAAVGGVLVLALATWSTSGTDAWTVSHVGAALATLTGAALVLRGVVSLPHDRPAAYRWLIRGLLVWILVAQVFVFYTSQLAGLGGLAIDLVAYGSLRLALAREALARDDSEGA